jgi:cytochrome c2
LVVVSASANAATSTQVQPVVDEQIAAGEQLTQQYCIQCHARPSPQQHTPEQLLNVVIRMERYMGSRRFTVPDDKATAAILAYLDSGSE